MKGTLKVVDDLIQVAKDMIDFILKSHNSIRDQNRHIAELSTIMKEIEDEYNKPLLTSWSMLYRVYRQYAADQGILYTEIPSLDDQILILEVITNFLKNTACDSRSGNLILMDWLLAKLSKYAPVENDERFAFTTDIRETIVLGIKLALRNAFIQQAKETLASYKSQIALSPNVVSLNAMKK